MQQVLKNISKAGLKLNKEKCIFGESQVKFLGHIVSSDGIKADPAKISAVRDMPIPENKKSLQSFLGMVNYLGKFINNLSELTAPLRTLLIKDSVWSLSEPQIAAINRLKEVLTTAPVLNFYNPSQPTRVSVDASSHGLGASLEQQDTDAIWQPIGFASRSLTSAERNCAQIEKETLAIVFACEKFHDYLYGRSFIVFSDHRPLKSIFSKSITQCPPRIQRFILRLQKYRFDLDFVPGKDMNVSDALSRAHLKDATSKIPKSEMELYIHSIVSNLPISEQRWKQLQFETAEDSTLQLLKNYTLHGWPSAFDQSVKPFFSIREEISYHDGVVLKGQRVIVPLKMRAEIKSILHQGHFGISRTQANARTSVFWPNITTKINDMISNCSNCIDHQNSQQREPLISHDVPNSLWEKIGTDLFTLFNKDYVIAVDYYSKFMEISQIPDKESQTVITHLKSIFSRHGIPKEVISDNGPEFSSTSFSNFAKQWDFKHNPSSPRYPQSNGLIFLKKGRCCSC